MNLEWRKCGSECVSLANEEDLHTAVEADPSKSTGVAELGHSIYNFLTLAKSWGMWNVRAKGKKSNIVWKFVSCFKVQLLILLIKRIIVTYDENWLYWHNPKAKMAWLWMGSSTNSQARAIRKKKYDPLYILKLQRCHSYSMSSNL